MMTLHMTIYIESKLYKDREKILVQW